MQLNRGAEGGGRGCGAPPDGKQLRCRERELVAQLHELLFPSPPPPSAAGGSMSWSSSSLSADLFVERCSLPVEAPASCGKRRGREARESGRDTRRRSKSSVVVVVRLRRRLLVVGGGRRTPTTTIVTTVPDFDGYQWKKYGQKQIEAAKYPRSYYRCTNSMDQACPAKRTVQRNEDGDGDGGQPKYTVVYISEHRCKTAEAVAAPVILETTARTKSLAAPDDAAVFASSSSAASTGTQSPATSDITWSGCTVAGANPTPTEFAADSDCWEWDPSPAAPAVAAAALLQEMDFARPIMSPVHVAATDGSWINDLFVNESLFVLNSSQLFGF